MKEAIFHPEARAEMRESIEFYERGLKGSVSGSCQPWSRRRNGFPLTRRQAPHWPANSASGSFRVFPTTSSIVFGRITSTLLQSLTITGVRVIGATDPLVANHRLEESLCAPQSKR